MWNLLNAVRRRRHLRRIDAALDGRIQGIERELKVLHQYLKPGEAFLDVGANMGDYVYVARKYLPAGDIYAFEPQETYIHSLRSHFPGVHVTHGALSSGPGEMRLKIPIVKGALYRTRATLEHFSELGEEGAVFETVPVMTLDSAVESFGTVKIGCIKIDVEGHERAVLEGAKETIARHTPVLIIEIEQRHSAEPITNIFRFIESLGYSGYFLNAALELMPLSRFAVGTQQRPESFKTPEYINNFIFLPGHGKD